MTALAAIRGSRGDYPLDEGKHLIVVAEWWAYGDETGIQEGSDFCSVLGYVGSPRQWKLFRRDWRKLVPRGTEFHASKFFQKASWRSKDSPYHGWSDKKARRFLNGLLATIDRYDIRPIGFAFNIADFFALNEDERRRLTGAVRWTNTRIYRGRIETIDKLLSTGAPGEPYFLGFHYFITQALRTSPAGATINYLFDRRKTREALALETFDEIKKYSDKTIQQRLGMLAFDDSDKQEPLQAADLYAYAWNRKLHGRRMSDSLEHALQKMGRKRDQMEIGGANLFRVLLEDLDRRRAEGIERAKKVARGEAV